MDDPKNQAESPKPPARVAGRLEACENPKTFDFILNSIEVQGDLPIEIMPGYYLQRADPEQLRQIKGQFAKLFPDNDDPYLFNVAQMLYEHHKVVEGNNAHWEALPPEKWRYWVVVMDNCSVSHDVAIAASLMQQDLHLGITFNPVRFVPDDPKIPPHISYGIGMHYGQLSVFYSSPDARFSMKPIATLKDEEVKEIGPIFNTLREHRSSPFYHAAQRFHYLKDLPANSEFADLAVFAIIESLITHCPKPSDPTESLTRQVSSKMCLLSRRFQRPLDYTKFFKTAQENQKVWKTLYEYRSKIAHGDPADFTDNRLKMLESKEKASAFLREAAKLLIIQALREPELIADLKNC